MGGGSTVGSGSAGARGAGVVSGAARRNGRVPAGCCRSRVAVLIAAGDAEAEARRALNGGGAATETRPPRADAPRSNAGRLLGRRAIRPRSSVRGTCKRTARSPIRRQGSCPDARPARPAPAAHPAGFAKPGRIDQLRAWRRIRDDDGAGRKRTSSPPPQAPGQVGEAFQIIGSNATGSTHELGKGPRRGRPRAPGSPEKFNHVDLHGRSESVQDLEGRRTLPGLQSVDELCSHSDRLRQSVLGHAPRLAQLSQSTPNADL